MKLLVMIKIFKSVKRFFFLIPDVICRSHRAHCRRVDRGQGTGDRGQGTEGVSYRSVWVQTGLLVSSSWLRAP